MVNIKPNKIERVGFFLRPNKPELGNSFHILRELFEKYGVEVSIESESAKMIGEKGEECSTLAKESDILISFGGDGTLLSTARKTFYYRKPILPINGGNLGFLVDLNIDEVEKFIPLLLKGEYFLEKRDAFKVDFKWRESEFALNDLFITNTKRMKMTTVHVYRFDERIGEKVLINSYNGDALIISTPTGSTAYNLSSGGPILYPEMVGYVLTPMAPHSLTQRPIVLPPSIEICVSSGSDSILAIDGQKNIKLEKESFAKISIHSDPIQIIRVKNYNFFNTLRKKLNWGYLTNS